MVSGVTAWKREILGETDEQEMLQKEPALQELPATEKEVKPEIGYKQASQSYRTGFWLR